MSRPAKSNPCTSLLTWESRLKQITVREKENHVAEDLIGCWMDDDHRRLSYGQISSADELVDCQRRSQNFPMVIQLCGKLMNFQWLVSCCWHRGPRAEDRETKERTFWFLGIWTHGTLEWLTESVQLWCVQHMWLMGLQRRGGKSRDPELDFCYFNYSSQSTSKRRADRHSLLHRSE